MNIEYKELNFKVAKASKSEYVLIVKELENLPPNKQLSFNYKDTEDYKKYPIQDLSYFTNIIKQHIVKLYGKGLFHINSSRETGEVVIYRVEEKMINRNFPEVKPEEQDYKI